MSLFRDEALATRADRLSGDVVIAVPVAWQVIGFLLAGTLIAALIFLSLASYARVETVTGIIAPDAGAAQIIAPRAGVVSALSVKEGDRVEAGAALAAIRVEEDSVALVSAAGRLEVAIADQDASLASQAVAVQAAAAAQLGQLAAQRAGLSAEIAQLGAQINLQQQLVKSAQRDLGRAREVAKRGFISGRDLQSREEILLSRRQGLSQLTQSLESRRAALSEAERTGAQMAAKAKEQEAAVSGARAQVAQQAANASGLRSYVVRAPVAGRVTALTSRIGQPAGPQTSLMTIVPAGSILRAELAVSSAAIGFVKPGQDVRLAIDAFPYQRFGTLKGNIQTIASSPIGQAGADGRIVPVYPATASIEGSKIRAFGRDEALVSGMTLSARIVTEKQSLLEWLFEPLYAVSRR